MTPIDDSLAFLLRWANATRANGMPTPEECEADGYEALGPADPRYPHSILMRKAVRDDD